VTDKGDLIAERYRLDSLVGTGAMGVVWQAHDELLRRTVAVKQLLLHPNMNELQANEAKRRAMREGRIAARLHHPHAISVYDVAEHDGRPCLIMEYLPSESLSAVLDARGALPPVEAARIGGQIASALAAAHKAGIVHRDIKPANVLLAEDGTAKITDFGISRAVGDGTVTAKGILAGTPAYLAPEIAQGHDAGFAADVFSLGATLYAAVEGVPPFGVNDNAIALLYRIATGEITPPRQAGPLGPLLRRMLALDPAGRPLMRDAQEALDQIAELPEAPVVGLPVAEVPSTPPPPSAPAPAPAPWSANRRPVIIAAVVVVLLLVAVTVRIIQLNNASATTTTHDGLTSTTASTQTTTSTTTAPPKTSANQPPPAQSPGDQLKTALTDYYSLVPSNLTEGWKRLTTDYKNNHAGGFPGYQGFWSQFDSVRLSDVVATPPATVVATIEYHYKDGRTTKERTTFGMVDEGGLWKIATSA
jgi:eukaryotic-like serine/threonine-protein kinase